MLDVWIIEKIIEREQERDRPTLQLPLPENEPKKDVDGNLQSEEPRGVFIIKINGDEDEEK